MVFRRSGFVLLNVIGRATVLLCMSTTSAVAQSTYATASVGTEVSRFMRFEQDIPSDGFTGGEAVFGALRVGTAVGERWGVELEFARPAALNHSSILGSGRLDLPFDEPQLHIKQEKASISMLAWVPQRVGSAVQLVYLGGVTFHRTATAGRLGPERPADSRFDSKLTEYSTGPTVGMEARIALTTHVQVVPGVRLDGIQVANSNGWLLRADAGISWVF
jgi:hypothetical protein